MFFAFFIFWGWVLSLFSDKASFRFIAMPRIRTAVLQPEVLIYMVVSITAGTPRIDGV
jgi:hypothetical protein